jgi:hypothetical protein
VLGCCRGRAGEHAPSPVVFYSAGSFCLRCFLVLDRLYLTVCFGLDLALSLLFSTDCL